MTTDEIVRIAIKQNIDPCHLAKLMQEINPNLYGGIKSIEKVCIGSKWFYYDYRRMEWREF